MLLFTTDFVDISEHSVKIRSEDIYETLRHDVYRPAIINHEGMIFLDIAPPNKNWDPNFVMPNPAPTGVVHTVGVIHRRFQSKRVPYSQRTRVIGWCPLVLNRSHRPLAAFIYGTP